jgi:CheY-like chemotaxis protein
MPMPVFCSVQFAGKFHAAIDEVIYPEIKATRQVQLLGASLNLAEFDSDSFWMHAPATLQDVILSAWTHRWDGLKLVSKDKPDGSSVMQVMAETKRLRELLQPDQPDDYDLPRIANREIKMLAALLDPVTDWLAKLEYTWEVASDIYEQEHDPRVFQERAREGALRDGLLAELEKLPVAWGDLIILLAHRVFPRVSTQFLEKFVANFGTTEKNREEFLPFTMQYLKKAREMPDIAYRERKEEDAYRQQAAALRDHLNGRAAATAKVKRPPVRDLAKLKQTVLVADSSDHSRRLLCQLLRAAGVAAIEEVRDGYLALDLLRAAPTLYGLVIADYAMKPGSGMHLLTVLRSDPTTPVSCRQIPFVMTSLAADVSFKREVYGAGANAILTKPLAAKTLVTAALEALNA